MSDYLQNDALRVFLFAFLVRVGGVMLTTLTDLNPDEGGDATGFANHAAAYASGELTIIHFFESFGGTYPTWGFVLSPFWVLPGPSRIYARLGIALIGAFAIYNVYLIVRQTVSRQAALFAVIPLTVFPSFVALQSVILRDAAMLACMTYAVRLLVVRDRWPTGPKYALVLLAIGFASLLRVENLPIYAVMAGTAAVIWGLSRRHYGAITVGGAILAIFAYFANAIAQWLDILRGHDSILEFLLFLRAARIREDGRTQYLTDVTLETPLDVALYAPRGAVYFLFAPLPWLAESAVDYLMVIESMVMIGFAIAGLSGFVRLWQRRPQLAGALLVGLMAAALFYGVISTNVGTSVRQRQVFSWIIFVFGGIGIADRYHVRVIWPWNRADSIVKSDSKREEPVAGD
ncbi:glycosyltransferase family 39 protein [Natronorubrum bangense]|uniref:Uncharacterized protein n=1 Tax=Natronorubrum bangense JCM 10635 TaxID=1227500 RepID=L9VZJ3_9EURY|nr:glycosyltransferase family 39 protein [Natronorubrum bangense]ELY42659.1 hypothetical protein C494_20183 [Natronorubrum bangense JCM 10635]